MKLNPDNLCIACGLHMPKKGRADKRPKYCKDCRPKKWTPDYRREYMRRWQQENPDKAAYKNSNKCQLCGIQITDFASHCNPCANHVLAKRQMIDRYGFSPSLSREEMACLAQRIRRQRRRGQKHRVPWRIATQEIENILAIGQTIYPGEELHLDHIVPVTRGGAFTRGNIHAIPAGVNIWKHDKLPQEVYKQLALA